MSDAETAETDGWKAALKEVTDFLLDLFGQTSNNHVQEIKTRIAREEQLQAELDKKEALEKDLQMKLTGQKSASKNAAMKLIRKINRKHCPACGAIFHALVTNESLGGDCIVHCESCYRQVW